MHTVSSRTRTPFAVPRRSIIRMRYATAGTEIGLLLQKRRLSVEPVRAGGAQGLFRYAICYAPATRCPVLRSRVVVLEGW
eukprot:1336610-Rhodomonas_salina.5